MDRFVPHLVFFVSLSLRIASTHIITALALKQKNCARIGRRARVPSRNNVVRLTVSRVA